MVGKYKKIIQLSKKFIIHFLGISKTNTHLRLESKKYGWNLVKKKSVYSKVVQMWKKQPLR